MGGQNANVGSLVPDFIAEPIKLKNNDNYLLYADSINNWVPGLMSWPL